jgi:L-aspartate oxidase
VTEPIPVIPAAHYFMGGIWTDIDGRTSLPGLWACGECTSTGAHGANRLASNSLLEAVVFSARIAETLKAEIWPDAPKDWQEGSVTTPSTSPKTITDQDGGAAQDDERQSRRAAGRRGHARGAANNPALWREADSVRFANVITTAKLIAVCALNRTESRGGHFRTDHPEERTDWKRRTLTTLDQADAIIPDLLEG